MKISASAFGTADASSDALGTVVATDHLYRFSIPGDKRFLHKDTLRGSDETQWMATYVSGNAGKQL